MLSEGRSGPMDRQSPGSPVPRSTSKSSGTQLPTHARRERHRFARPRPDAACQNLQKPRPSLHHRAGSSSKSATALSHASASASPAGLSRATDCATRARTCRERASGTVILISRSARARRQLRRARIRSAADCDMTSTSPLASQCSALPANGHTRETRVTTHRATAYAAAGLRGASHDLEPLPAAGGVWNRGLHLAYSSLASATYILARLAPPGHGYMQRPVPESAPLVPRRSPTPALLT